MIQAVKDNPYNPGPELEAAGTEFCTTARLNVTKEPLPARNNLAIRILPRAYKLLSGDPEGCVMYFTLRREIDNERFARALALRLPRGL